MKKNHNMRRSVLFTAIAGGSIFFLMSMGGYFSAPYIPAAVTISLLKFSIAIIGIVWFFSLAVYNKLSDITDLLGLDYHQHRNIESEIRSRLHWFWIRAIFLGLLAILIYTPSIVREAGFSVPSWLIAIAFGSLGLAFYSLKPLWGELEEIREFKSYVKEIERREKERTEQIKTMKDGLKTEWQIDQNLDGFRKSDDTHDNSK